MPMAISQRYTVRLTSSRRSALAPLKPRSTRPSPDLSLTSLPLCDARLSFAPASSNCFTHANIITVYMLIPLVNPSHSASIATPLPHATNASSHPQTCTSGAALGATFCTALADAVPVAVYVQLLPQPYPLGQHPPPKLAAQLDQPAAQEPLSVANEAPVCATIVMPLLTKPVVETAGQDVFWQSRPTRQQPP